MKLQDQMFGLIAEWCASKLFKKDFLADKKVSQGKFDYWLKKYHSSKINSTDKHKKTSSTDFSEITFPVDDHCGGSKNEIVKILELISPSGLQINIYEKC